MRRVLYALPFLLIGLGVLMVELTVYRLLVVGLNWLTFLIEYRCGGEGRGGELVAIGIATSLALSLCHRRFQMYWRSSLSSSSSAETT
ncbi:hypothetical protein [Thermococcus henrietii]|uniref:hypothetical protein n=1 Tax=Thermococcus henrietii TaxID=2016361 RepID=UPI000C083CAC|nr:hypothetical protein [Thermococcus henrietii]